MTREDFRREIGDAFDSIGGSPDPALSERVRSALMEAPEQRTPVWAVALAAVVVAVILVGVVLLVNPLKTPPVTSHPGPSPSAVPSASPTPACLSDQLTVTNQTAPPLAFVDAVRVGTHADLGYDRITIEFKDATTGTIQVIPQANTKFVTDPKGDTVTLAGNYGMLIRIIGADNHTAYAGSRDFKTPTFPGIREVRQVGDSEGRVLWAVGLSSSACYQTQILSSPTRLVIDVRTG